MQLPELESIHFFKSPEEFRGWLQNNAAIAKEVWVGFYKVHTGKPTLTWSESVDQALCFGWIDGIRKSIDTESYAMRFTPRNPKSVWSSINLKKVEVLKQQGLMQPQGLKAYELRDKSRSEIYSFEQQDMELPEPYFSLFRQKTELWEKFNSMSASYKKAAIWWVKSAKQEATRAKRFSILADCTEKGEKIPLYQR